MEVGLGDTINITGSGGITVDFSTNTLNIDGASGVDLYTNSTLRESDIGLLDIIAGTGIDVTYSATGKVTVSSTYSSVKLVGDVLADGNTGSPISASLAIVNANVGTFGDATHIPVITADSKGRVTALSDVAVSIPSGSISVTGSDLTLSGNTGTAITNATLATVNSNVGSFGSSTLVPTITVNEKGLVTAVTTNTIESSSGNDVEAGDGMNFVTNDPVTLGLPSTIDSTTENAVTATSHTHELGTINIENVVKIESDFEFLYKHAVCNDIRDISSSDEWIVPLHTHVETMLDAIDTSIDDGFGNLSWPNAGKLLKSYSTNDWENAGLNTNAYQFNLKGSGFRFANIFNEIRNTGGIMCSDTYTVYNQYVYKAYSDSDLMQNGGGEITDGWPIRLCNPSTILEEGEFGTYTQNNGEVIDTVVIGGIEWTQRALTENEWRDHSLINQVQPAPAWEALDPEDSAFCVYENSAYYLFDIQEQADVVSGLGMDFITNEAVDLGLPSEINGTTENALTETSHTHKLGNVPLDNVVSGSPVEYGALYNWWAATDGREITSSDDWEVPTSTQFETLQTYLGGESVAGGKLKETGTAYWDDPNTGATNEVGFNARGAGGRSVDGLFDYPEKQQTEYWTINDYGIGTAYLYELYFESGSFSQWGTSKIDGWSIRLIKDSTSLSDGETGTYTGNDGKVYPTICIGTQEWLACNLNETQYRNGDWIHGFDDGVYTPIADATWAALTTEAMCYYDDNEAYGGGETPVSIPAAQVNSDWDAVSGVAEILNKPTIPAEYTLPTASDTVLGGVKVGSGLSIDGGGVLSSAGGGNDVVAGDGMDFVTNDPVTLGLPSTIDSNTTNAVTETSHTHKLGNVAVDKITEITPFEYGPLYNYYAASDARKILSSDDWIVPTMSDFQTLADYLGAGGNYSGNSVGGKLKEAGTTWWDSPNTGATNEVGFNARGTGQRSYEFQYYKQYIDYWTTTLMSGTTYATAYLAYNADYLYVTTGHGNLARQGLPIRPVKATTTLLHGETGTYIGNDGKVYPTICIGTQEWLAQNLNETKYRNGDWITGFDGGVYTPISDGAWLALTTEAMCYYSDNENSGGEEIPFTPFSGDYDDLTNKPTIPTINANYLKDWIEFEFRDIEAGTAADYVLDLKALVDYDIDSAVLQVDAGTLTVAIKIGATAVTSLSAVAADTSITETAATAANTVAAGDKVILAVSATYTGAPTLIRGKLNLTRT